MYLTETAMIQPSKIITRNTVRFCPQSLSPGEKKKRKEKKAF
jgi:hypothetical protein